MRKLIFLLALLIVINPCGASETRLKSYSETMIFGFAAFKVKGEVLSDKIEAESDFDFRAQKSGPRGNLKMTWPGKIIINASLKKIEEFEPTASPSVEINGAAFLEGKEIYKGPMEINDSSIACPVELSDKLFRFTGKINFKPETNDSKKFKKGDMVKGWQISLSGTSYYNDPKVAETNFVCSEIQIDQKGIARIPFISGYAEVNLFKNKVEKISAYVDFGFAHLEVDPQNKTLYGRDLKVSLAGSPYQISGKAKISQNGNKVKRSLSLKINLGKEKAHSGKVELDETGFSFPIKGSYQSIKWAGTFKMKPVIKETKDELKFKLIEGMECYFSGDVEAEDPLSGKLLKTSVEDLKLNRDRPGVPFEIGNLSFELFRTLDGEYWQIKQYPVGPGNAFIEGKKGKFIGKADFLKNSAGPKFNITLTLSKKEKELKCNGGSFWDGRKIFHGNINFQEAGEYSFPWSISSGKVSASGAITCSPVFDSKSKELTDWKAVFNGETQLKLGFPQGTQKFKVKNAEIDKKGNFSISQWKVKFDCNVVKNKIKWSWK